jgi:hypothetical protein
MDFTYWFPWKYAGVRFQGAGLDISGGGGPRSRVVTFPGVFIGSPGNGNNEFVERTVFVSRREGAPATQPVTLRGRNISRLEQDFPGGSQVLGHVGGGLEYRFTPHIGIFGEVGYDFPNLSNNNFIQTNFGLRFAF